MQDTEQQHKTEILNDFNDMAKKRISVYKVDQYFNGETKVVFQLLIVDPFMTINIDINEQTAVNMAKALQQYLKQTI